MKKKIKLIDLKKYGFLIDNSKRKWHTKSKRMMVRESVANALVKARESLPKGYNFKIWDAKRYLSAQRIIVKKLEKDFKKKYPNNYIDMLNKFCGGYDSITKDLPIYSHRKGGAIDLTIVNNKRKELDMGGVTYTKTDHLNYFEKKKKLTKKDKKVRDNRRFLKKVMKKAGFKQYFPEWWHWGYSK